MKNIEMYKGAQIDDVIEEIVPIYQTAFKGDPWNENSKCPRPDLELCAGGLSPIEIGQFCLKCQQCPNQEAYPADELTAKFEKMITAKNCVLILEREGRLPTMAMFGWVAGNDQIASERYEGSEDIDTFFQVNAPPEFMWLDEVFADRQLKPEGNLRDFRSNCTRMLSSLGVDSFMYRTIAPQMIRAVERDFPEESVILRPPDRRLIVKVALSGGVS